MKKPLLIITGANGQIGSYLAQEYAGSGNPVLLLYHKRKERIAELEKFPHILMISCDLCQPVAVNNALDEAVSALNSVPAFLIHTAAVRSSDAQPLLESDPQIFRNTIDQNIMAAYNVLRFCLPRMKRAGLGRIVLFGSMVTTTGLAQGSAYAASKAAIVNLMKSIALENNDWNLRINTISPAPVETALEEDYQGEYLAFRRQYFANWLAGDPNRRLVTKAEIKAVIATLLSIDNEVVNAQEIFLGQNQEKER